MLTSKQRALLRALAQKTEPILQIGKGGLTDNMIKQYGEALEARELIKITVLKSSEFSPKEAADEIALKTGADVVQVIGNRFVLYKESVEKKRIDINDTTYYGTSSRK
jgi:RNA-binding protein